MACEPPTLPLPGCSYAELRQRNSHQRQPPCDWAARGLVGRPDADGGHDRRILGSLVGLNPKDCRQACGRCGIEDSQEVASVPCDQNDLGRFAGVSGGRGASSWRRSKVGGEKGVARLGGGVSGTKVRADNGVLNGWDLQFVLHGSVSF